MRTLAIDLGTKRIGLAMSDEGGRFATPLEVLTVSDPATAIEPIIRLVDRESVQRVIVGLPLNMDGTFGPQAKKVISWTRQLEAKMSNDPLLPPRRKGSLLILFVDERLSSFEAEQRLAARKKDGEKLTRKRKKQQLDAIAAAGFLQAFLDGKLPALDTDVL